MSVQYTSHISLTTALLRPHRVEDGDHYVAAGRDPEFYKMLGMSVPLIPEAQEAKAWVRKKIDSIPSWAIEVDNLCIGSTRIHSIEPVNRRGRFSIEIFNPAYRGKGIGTEVTGAVVAIAFEELHLHRLDLRVFTINEPAIRCYERNGFRREGIERDTALLDGVWHSDLFMSILEDEYRAATDTAGA